VSDQEEIIQPEEEEESNITPTNMATASAIGLRQPASFEYQRNCSRWDTWVRQFNMFLLASGIKGDEQQTNTFFT
jgi:hypothetical protein